MLGVHRHVVEVNTFIALNGQLAVALHGVDQVGRQRIDRIHLAGLQRRDAGGVFRAWRDVNVIDLRPAFLPVTVKLAQLDLFSRLPADKFERAGAGGMQAQLRFVRVLLQHGRAPHHRRRVCECVDKGAKRLVEVDFDLGRRDDGDGFNHLIQAVTLQTFGLIGQPVEVSFYCGSIKWRAVLEADVFTQIEREFGSVRVAGVIGRQPRNQLHFAVELEQAFKDPRLHRIAGIVRGIVRIKSGDINIGGNPQVLRLGDARQTQ